MEATKDVEMTTEIDVRSVAKRDNTKQTFDKQKLYNRLNNLIEDLDKSFVSIDEVVNKVASGVYDGKKFLYNH